MLTVMAGLPFEEVAEQMERIGVKMTIIDPLPGWTKRFTDEWSDETYRRATRERYC